MELDKALETLQNNIISLIEKSKESLSVSVNREVVFLYWNIGKMIKSEIIKSDRAEYGERIVDDLSTSLKLKYGSGYSRQNIFSMIKFFEVFNNFEIVSTLSRQLSWSHFRELLYLKENLKIEFYSEICRIERWSVRTLRDRIQSMLYERTAISKKPDELIKSEIDSLRTNDTLSTDMVFRDPYILDFLGLKDTYSEKDLENSILKELERFILELGSDFCFIARQKRITIDSDDYYIDLLFYHRKLKRLIAIDLKIGKFKAEFKGQMELYLRWLDKYEKMDGESSPIGLILCAEKKSEHLELLKLEESGIKVAEYLTELPPENVLKEKLHKAIEIAKKQIEFTHQDI